MNRFFYHLLRFLLFLLAMQICQASTQRLTSWNNIMIQGDFMNNPQWQYMVDEQVRTAPTQFDENLFQTALGYQFYPVLAFWLGYVSVTKNDMTGVRPENRIFQQITWELLSQNYIKMNIRSRIEERFFAGDEHIRYRWRERLLVSFPETFLKPFSPIISEEMFTNVGPRTRLWNQNRAFIGLEYPLLNQVKLQMGYMHRIRFDATETRIDHIAVLSININL